MSGWTANLLLLAAMTLATAIRFVALDGTALSPDECFSWQLAQYPFREIGQRTALDVHPPLWYGLLRIWFALAGDSPWALRSFSVFWGVLGVLLVYGLCLEGCRAVRGGVDSAARGAALVSAFLFAIHPTQVQAARFGRMYSLGVCLAALSAWLLLRALRSRRPLWWWAGYGATAAAFAYTHYFAFFTLLAQALFVVGVAAVQCRRGQYREAASCLAGLLYAGALALTLYLPWLPALLAQIGAVRSGYWIPAMSWDGVMRTLVGWVAGVSAPGPGVVVVGLVLLVLIVGTSWLRGDGSARFFLLQALIPWGLTLSTSALSGTSIFVERYLVFGHVALLSFWGWFWQSLPGATWRVLATSTLGSLALLGLVDDMSRWPSGPPAVERATAFLSQRLEPGDFIIVSSAVEANRLRCYLSLAGNRRVALRVRYTPFARDIHFSHAAALDGETLLKADDLARTSVKRVWVASVEGAALPVVGLVKEQEATFATRTGPSYTLVLWVRRPDATSRRRPRL